MSNVLRTEKRIQIIALGKLRWPLRRIQQETGIRRETVSKYLKAAGIPVREPRHRALPEPRLGGSTGPPPLLQSRTASETSTDLASTSMSASGVSTDSGGIAGSLPEVPASPFVRNPASACEPYREFIERSLRLGRNATAIYQDLVDDHGFGHRYASVKRFVRGLRSVLASDVHPIIQTAPGEEAQVDYGDGPMVRHPQTGRYRRVRLFVFTLGYSRKCVRLLVWRSDSKTWAELHEKAFRRLGGATSVVVPDNLKEGVIQPDVYDPALNTLYRDVLAHYGAVCLPARVRHPNRKGKVESAVGHAKNTPLKGMRFESLEEAQAYLDRWEKNWADTRIHGTTKRQVAAMFAEEKPYLLPLPAEPFRYYSQGLRTVHTDGTVEVAAAYYSAPLNRIGQRLVVQWNDGCVRLLDAKTHQLLREHLRQPRGRYRLDPRDIPPKTPQSTEQLLARAHRAGASIGALCDAIHGQRHQTGVRSILGVLSLVRKYGPIAVDNAAAFALEAGLPTYRCLRKYLDHQPAPQLALKHLDPLIRELNHYRAIADRMAATKETPCT
jgi:transposase